MSESEQQVAAQVPDDDLDEEDFAIEVVKTDTETVLLNPKSY